MLKRHVVVLDDFRYDVWARNKGAAYDHAIWMARKTMGKTWNPSDRHVYLLPKDESVKVPMAV